MRELQTIGQATLHGYDAEDCVAFEVQDDGFAPRICSGDFVVVHTCAAVKDGDLAVVKLGETSILLRRVRFEGTQITLTSDNCPDISYTPIVLTLKEFERIDTFKVVGVMLGNLRTR